MVHYNQAQTIDNLNDQLFAEISSEQAAVVEGGTRRVTIGTIRCLEAGGGSDRVFATFNSQDTSFGRMVTMQKNSVANLGQSSNFNSSNGSILVRLRDAVDGSRTKSVFLGRFTLPSGTPPSSGTRTIAANGSRYEVSFSAF